MTNINTTMGVQQWLMLITLSVLWGGSFFFVEIALADLPTLSIVTMRVALAAIVLWGVVAILRLKVPKGLGIWMALALMGALNNALPFALITWGQTQIASGLASILNAAMPFFTVIVAGIFLPDEKVSPLKITGVLIGFLGVAVMIGLPQAGETGKILAQFAILAAGLSYAFASTYGRRFKQMGIHPIVLSAGQISASTLLILPIALQVDGVPDLSTISLNSVMSIIALAVLSTSLAYVLYFKILESAGAINISLVTLLVPVSAIFLGAVFLGERLEVIHFIGMGLIALGLSAIDGRLWRFIKTR